MKKKTSKQQSFFYRHHKAIAVILFLLISVVGYFALIKKSPTEPSSQQPISGKTTITYINTILGFSITYPATWPDHESPYANPPGSKKEMPDSRALRVFIAPENPRTLCNVLAPVTPARYLDIRSEEGSLNENRERMKTKVGGQDYKESTMILAGENVFVYTPAYDEPPCQDGFVQSFMTILVPHDDEVFSITTDMYSLQEVKDAIMSLQFISI